MKDNPNPSSHRRIASPRYTPKGNGGPARDGYLHFHLSYDRETGTYSMREKEDRLPTEEGLQEHQLIGRIKELVEDPKVDGKILVYPQNFSPVRLTRLEKELEKQLGEQVAHRRGLEVVYYR